MRCSDASRARVDRYSTAIVLPRAANGAASRSHATRAARWKRAQATITLVWTVEFQDAVGKPRRRLRIRLLTPEEMEKNKPRRKRRRRE